MLIVRTTAIRMLRTLATPMSNHRDDTHYETELKRSSTVLSHTNLIPNDFRDPESIEGVPDVVLRRQGVVAPAL